MGCIVGIDPGQARIGVAISDEERSIAFPRETVRAKGGTADAARRVREAVADDEVSLAVVGLPLRLDGTEGEAARRACAGPSFVCLSPLTDFGADSVGQILDHVDDGVEDQRR